MRRFFRVAAWIFGVLYAIAFVISVIGWFGLFGVTHDGLVVILLIPLGLPWNFAGDLLPLALQPYFSIIAPAINLAILWWLSREPAPKPQ